MAQGVGKSEREACEQALRQMQEQGQATLPPMVSDGWGGIREALVEVYGEVPAYGGRGRPPTQPQACPEWRYLQMVKHRSPTGKLLSIEPKAVYGTLEDLHDLGLQTSYIERTHLSMRQHHARLTRKSLSFSKSWHAHQQMLTLETAFYNLCSPLSSLRIEIAPDAPRFQPKYEAATPAMAAGLTSHIWTLQELLRKIPIPYNS